VEVGGAVGGGAAGTSDEDAHKMHSGTFPFLTSISPSHTGVRQLLRLHQVPGRTNDFAHFGPLPLRRAAAGHHQQVDQHGLRVIERGKARIHLLLRLKTAQMPQLCVTRALKTPIIHHISPLQLYVISLNNPASFRARVCSADVPRADFVYFMTDQKRTHTPPSLTPPKHQCPNP
jgi:hypothetical protein